MRKWTSAVALAALAMAAWAQPATAQSDKLVFGLPGLPPVFSTIIAYVARDQGFFKKYGVNVELRQFDTGTAAARAVASGDIDFSLSPSPLIVNQISNANVNVVAIYGLPNPDWLLASTDKAKSSCKDMVGQPVGVDTPGGARSIALKEMLVPCGVKVEDVQQVSLGSNIGPAMLAGSLTFGVLHLDDVPSIEAQGKPVTVITTMKKTSPNSHYLLGVTRIDRLAANRDAYVRLVAGLTDASRYMQDPANAARIAEIAQPTGRTLQEAKDALKGYVDMGFWALDDDGMDRAKLEAVIRTQAAVGGITAGKEPVKYERLVDPSVWRDAAALTKKP